MTLRLGLIGLGYGAAVLAPAFRLDPRVEIVGVCGRRPDKTREIADRLGVGLAVDDWRDLLERDDVDAVAIAVPPTEQSQIAEAALDHGLHVFAEKPLAESAARARELEALAGRTGLAAMVDFGFRGIPAFARARELMQQGAVGRLRHLTMNWQVESIVYARGLDHWKASRENGGGALTNFVAHSLDLLEWLGAPVTAMSALLAPLPGDARTGETFVSLSVAFAGGAAGSLTMSPAAFSGTGHRIELYGDDGSLVLDNPGPDHMRGFTLWQARRGEAERAAVPCEPWPAALTGDARIYPASRLTSAFVDWALGGPPATPGFREGARVQTLIDAALASDAQGVRLSCASG